MSGSEEESVGSIDEAEMESLADDEEKIVLDEDEDEDEDDEEEEDGVVEKKASELKKFKETETGSKEDLLDSGDNFKFESSPDDEDIDDVDAELSEDDDDDLAMDKMEFDVKEYYLESFHPEKLHHNYDEVYNLSKVSRNKNNEIVDDLHKTVPIITKYEYSKILGHRASQLNSGSPPFIEIDENIMDSYVIAKMELQEKKIPFIIRRPLPSGGSEYWRVRDLELL